MNSLHQSLIRLFLYFNFNSEEQTLMNLAQPIFDFTDGLHTLWHVTRKTDFSCLLLADKHYSRQTVGATNFCRPGNNYVLRTTEGNAVWVSWLSKFRDDMFKAIECTIFRNESPYLSSNLIRLASLMTFAHYPEEDTIITYVDPRSVASKNPGYCYLKAGYKKLDHISKKRGLWTFAITRDELFKHLESIIQASPVFSVIRGLVQQIDGYTEAMNSAYAEYEMEMAAAAALKAFRLRMELQKYVEEMKNDRYQNSDEFIAGVLASRYMESADVFDLYEVLQECETYNEDIQAAVLLIEQLWIENKADVSGGIDEYIPLDEEAFQYLNWYGKFDDDIHENILVGQN
jgi:hypothetical protein